MNVPLFEGSLLSESANIDLDDTALIYLAGLTWSVFTLLTPLASSMGLVWIVLARIALGLGEGN